MADTFRLARSTFIKAPAATVHALVNDFHEWEKWSPWVKMDAGHLSQTYEGPASGVGAGYTWRGLPPEKTANLTEAKAVALAVDNPSLIRRPLIEHKDGSVTVGFSKKIQELLA